MNLQMFAGNSTEISVDSCFVAGANPSVRPLNLQGGSRPARTLTKYFFCDFELINIFLPRLCLICGYL